MQRISGLLLSLILSAAAEDHIVPEAEMQRPVASLYEKRRANLARAESFLSLDIVQQAFRTAKMDSGQIRTAVRLLSDGELAQLASQTDRLRADLQAGALSNQQLTYIVIALATAVLILIILAA